MTDTAAAVRAWLRALTGLTVLALAVMLTAAHLLGVHGVIRLCAVWTAIRLAYLAGQYGPLRRARERARLTVSFGDFNSQWHAFGVLALLADEIGVTTLRVLAARLLRRRGKAAA